LPPAHGLRGRRVLPGGHRQRPGGVTGQQLVFAARAVEANTARAALAGRTGEVGTRRAVERGNQGPCHGARGRGGTAQGFRLRSRGSTLETWLSHVRHAGSARQAKRGGPRAKRREIRTSGRGSVPGGWRCGGAVRRRTLCSTGSGLAVLAPPGERGRSPYGDGSDQPRPSMVGGTKTSGVNRAVEERQPRPLLPGVVTGRPGFSRVGWGHDDQPRRPIHQIRNAPPRSGSPSRQRASDRRRPWTTGKRGRAEWAQLSRAVGRRTSLTADVGCGPWKSNSPESKRARKDMLG
jgi:hypothetical protein